VLWTARIQRYTFGPDLLGCNTVTVQTPHNEFGGVHPPQVAFRPRVQEVRHGLRHPEEVILQRASVSSEFPMQVLSDLTSSEWRPLFSLLDDADRGDAFKICERKCTLYVLCPVPTLRHGHHLAVIPFPLERFHRPN